MIRGIYHFIQHSLQPVQSAIAMAMLMYSARGPLKFLMSFQNNSLQEPSDWLSWGTVPGKCNGAHVNSE